MRWLLVALMLCFAGFSGEAFALEDARVRAVQTCIQQTRAPGSYAMSTLSAVPHVVAHNGATELGVRNVNDCLKDRYQVQYGVDGVPWTDAVVQNEDAAKKCRRARNWGYAATVVISAGAAAAIGGDYAWVAGLTGVAVGASAVNNRYQTCLAAAGGPKRTGKINLSCNGGGGVMHSGDGYCLN